MHKSINVAAALAIAFGATSAMAAKRSAIRAPAVKAVMQRAAPMFQAADIDNSGNLDSMKWLSAGAPAESFGAVDVNNNGSTGFFEMVRVAVARVMASRRPG